MSDFKGYNKLQIDMLALQLTSQLMIENAVKNQLIGYYKTGEVYSEIVMATIAKIEEIERQLEDIRGISYSFNNVAEY